MNLVYSLYLNRPAKQKIFHLFLGVSFLLHAGIFSCLFYANSQRQDNPVKRQEVVYYTEALRELPPAIPIQKVVQIKEEKPQSLPNILPRQDASRPTLLGTAIKQTVKLETHKKQPSHWQNLEGKRHISVPVLEIEKMNNPKYSQY